jgi:hypothetical protein
LKISKEEKKNKPKLSAEILALFKIIPPKESPVLSSIIVHLHRIKIPGLLKLLFPLFKKPKKKQK